MPNPTTKMRVCLTPDQREHFEAICRQQSVPVSISRRARILLLADDGHPGGCRPDHEIAVAVGLSERQIVRIRQRFVREGDAAWSADRGHRCLASWMVLPKRTWLPFVAVPRQKAVTAGRSSCYATNWVDSRSLSRSAGRQCASV